MARDIEIEEARAIYAARQDVVEQLAQLDARIEELIDDGKHHTTTNVDWEDASAWIPSFKKVQKWRPLVLPELGFKARGLFAFMLQIQPQTRQGKYHIHGEAIKFYVKGRGLEHIGEKTYEVEAGDVILVPANTWHGTENPYDEPIEIFAVQMRDGTPLPVPIQIASASSNEASS